MKLFVGNLQFEVTDRELHDAFAAHVGVESAEVVKDKFTGKSRGFGFVTLISGADANTAIDALDGVKLRDRAIRVEVANSRDERRNSHDPGRGGRDRREPRAY